MKRSLSFVLALLMVASLPLTVFAQRDLVRKTEPACTHTHDDSCGYEAGEEGEELAPCGHVCGADCGVIPEEEPDEGEPGDGDLDGEQQIGRAHV